MSRAISAAALRAMFEQESDEVFLLCVTLSHSTFEKPYRMVYNNEPIERAAGTFEPAAFSLNLPEESEDEVPQVTLSVDNVSAEIGRAIRELPVGERPEVLLEVIMASSPDTVEVSSPFVFLSAQYDASTVSGTLGTDDDFLNISFPRQRYTPANSPAVFA